MLLKTYKNPTNKPIKPTKNTELILKLQNLKRLNAVALFDLNVLIFKMF